MMKLSKHIRPLLLCMICIFMLLPVKVFAADAIDGDRDVNLTIKYTHNQTPISGVQFDLYRVADANEYAEFTLAGDFKNYPVQVNGLSTEEWKTLAETLSAYASRDKLTPLDSGKTDSNGTLSFPNQQTSLKVGLYLVIGRQLSQDGYTYTTEPFLVSLPNLDTQSDTWTYDVTVTPKYTRKENSSTPDNQTVKRKVLKVWKDDMEQSRPKKVIVQLLKDGAVYDTVTLNAANNWRYTWKKLPEYNEDGSEAAWSVVEKEIEDYTVLITQEGVTFTVTNTYASDESEDDTATRKSKTNTSSKQKLPQTGVLWWPVPVLACGGILFLIVGKLSRKKNNHE